MCCDFAVLSGRYVAACFEVSYMYNIYALLSTSFVILSVKENVSIVK